MSIESEAQALLAKAIKTIEEDVEKIIHPAEHASAAAVAEAKAEVVTVKADVEAAKAKAEADAKAFKAATIAAADKAFGDAKKVEESVAGVACTVHPLAPHYLDAGMTIAFKEHKN